MASKLQLIARIQNLDEVKRLLTIRTAQPTVNDAPQGDWDVSWDRWDDWNAPTETRSTSAPVDSSETWLQDCVVSLSPACDLLVLARGNKAVFLQARGSPDASGVNPFSIVFSGELCNAIKQMRNDHSRKNPKDALDRFGSHSVTQPQTGEYQDENESITSVLCIPIASQKRSNLSLGSPDWTVVAVGFSTGFLQFYTEQGTLLCWQLFTDRPARIVSMRLRSYSQMRAQSEVDAQDELTLLLTLGNQNTASSSDRPSGASSGSHQASAGSNNLLVVINGLALLSTLNSARNTLARNVAAGVSENQREASVPQLAARKFSVAKQREHAAPFSDHVVCGASKTSLFEQLRSASFIGGFSESVRAESPTSHGGALMLACGEKPSYAFYSASETASPPLLDLTVHAVSKLRETVTSSIGGLFGLRRGKAAQSAAASGQSDSERAAALIDEVRKRAKAELAAAASFRFSFADDRRACLSVVLSGNARLAALVDRLGRVLLIDAKNGHVVRILKGARDGRCGWLRITESSGDSNIPKKRNASGQSSMSSSSYFSLSGQSNRDDKEFCRAVHCVVLYAPRRKVIELFLATNGPRIAAFTVSGCGTLLYTEHTLLGLNSTLAQFYNGTSAQPYFLDERGQLFAFDVPFAIAANAQSAERFLDLQTLKRIGFLCDALGVVLTARSRAEEAVEQEDSEGALVRYDAEGYLTIRVGEAGEYADAESAIIELLDSIRSSDILLDALRHLVAVPHMVPELLEHVLNTGVCANPRWNPHSNRLFGNEAQSIDDAGYEYDVHRQSDVDFARDLTQRSGEEVDSRLIRFSRHHLHLLSTYQFFANLPNRSAERHSSEKDDDETLPETSASSEASKKFAFADDKMATLQTLSNLEATVRKLMKSLPIQETETQASGQRMDSNSLATDASDMEDLSSSVQCDFTITDLFDRLSFDKLKRSAVRNNENLEGIEATDDQVQMDARFSAFLFTTYFDKLSIEVATHVTDELITHALHIPLSRARVFLALVTFWLSGKDRFSAEDCQKLATFVDRLVLADSDALNSRNDQVQNSESKSMDGDADAATLNDTQVLLETLMSIVLRECASTTQLVSALSFVHIFQLKFSDRTDCSPLAMLDARLRILIDFKQLLLHNVVHGFDMAMQQDSQAQPKCASLPLLRDFAFLHSMSVQGVLRAGKGAFTELFSKSLAAFWKVLPANAYLLDQVHYFYVNQNVSSFNDERFQLFVRLAQIFGHSFERNNVLLNISWELLGKWHRDFDEVELLTCAIDLLKALQTSTIIGGTVFHCNAQELIWRVHFARSVADLTVIVEKHGRMPNERVLRKTLALGDRALRAFLTALLRFFELFVENVRMLEQPGESARLDSVVDVFTHDAAFFEKLDLYPASTSEMTEASAIDEAMATRKCSVLSQMSTDTVCAAAGHDEENVNLSLVELLQEQEMVESVLVETRRELIHCLLIVSQLRIRFKPSALFRSALLDLIFMQPKMKLTLQRSTSRNSANSGRLLASANAQSSDDPDQHDYDLCVESNFKTAAAEFDWRVEQKAMLTQTNLLISAEMQKQRYAFLETAIVQSAKALADEYETAVRSCAGDDQLALTSIVMRLDGVKRADLILNAARLFQCDVDMLRRHYVTELYAFGLDQIASSVRQNVEDKRALRSNLIPIVATRLALQFMAEVPPSSRSRDEQLVIDALRYRFKMRVSLEYYLRSFTCTGANSSDESAGWKGTRLPSLMSNYEILEFLITCGGDLQQAEPKIFEIYEIISDAIRRN